MGFWDGTDEARTNHVNAALREHISEGVSLTGAGALKRMFMDEDGVRFLRNAAVDANPSSLLGAVYYMKGTDRDLVRHTRAVAVTEDASATQNKPVVMQEILIDSGGAAELDALSVVSFTLGAKEVLELRTIKTRSARADQRPGKWDDALDAWEAKSANRTLLDNPDVASILVVGGISQYFITAKSFTKYEGSAKGGGWGVNVGGELYTSSSLSTLDIVYAIEAIELRSSRHQERRMQRAADETLNLFAERINSEPRLFAPAPGK